MYREFSSKVLFIGFVAVLSCRVVAQTPSVSLSAASGAPGDRVTLTVSLSYNGGTRPAAVQWDLNYSIGDFIPSTGTFFSTGAAASAAGKSLACSSLTPGNVRCIVSGLKQNGNPGWRSCVANVSDSGH